MKLIVQCVIVILSCNILFAANKSASQLQGERERQEFLDRAAESKSGEPIQSVRPIVLPEKQNEVKAGVVYLKDGRSIEGKIISSQPATVTIKTVGGSEIQMLVTDLAVKTITNLPLTISGIYKDFLINQKNIEEMRQLLLSSLADFSNQMSKAKLLLLEYQAAATEESQKLQKRAEGKEYEIVSTTIKINSSAAGYTDFSWLVEAKSNFSKPIVGDLKVIFYDADGFKVDSASLDGVLIVPDRINKFTEKGFLKDNLYHSIKRTSVEITRR